MKRCWWLALVALVALGCDDDSSDDTAADAVVEADSGADAGVDSGADAAVELEGMEGATANCEFDGVTFVVDGEEIPVSINGLPVEVVAGAEKSGADTVDLVERRGVRFSSILERAGVDAEDEAPVNCVARDGWDPLRTRLAGDTTKLPTFAFLRDSGYVYVGSPGDKDPLYPDMEGKSLIVDYDLDSDSQVPENIGGALSAIGMFRWKMIERVDDEQYGRVEINPTP